ncbi:MAG: CinA family protein, partial [Hyphomicrobium sp.]
TAAESCTGGLIGALLTSIAGASDVFDRGFITYSNAAKTDMLGVPAADIATFGAVSREVATGMTKGALANSNADIAVSVTGIAGPGGGSDGKPVGLVYIAAIRRGGDTMCREYRFGAIGRNDIRLASVISALALIREVMP